MSDEQGRETFVDTGPAPRAEERGVERWLLTRGSSFYALVTLMLCLAKYGVGIDPSWNYLQALARHWRSPHASALLASPADFRLESPVSAVLAGWLHLTGNASFLEFHFVLVCVALTVPFAMPAVRHEAKLRFLVGLMIIGSAIPSLLLSWVGSYDPVSIIAASIAVLARSKWVSFLGWIVFAFNNGFEAIVAGVVVCVIIFFDEERRVDARMIPPVLGVTYGYVAIAVLDHTWGGATGPFTLFRFYGFHRYLVGALDYWPLIVASALGVGWVLLASREVRLLPAARACFAMSLVASLAIPLVALDETRITAGAMWAPILLVATICVRKLDTKAITRVLRRMTPVAVVLVLVVVWDGSLVYSGWHGAADVVGYFFLHHPIPAALAP